MKLHQTLLLVVSMVLSIVIRAEIALEYTTKSPIYVIGDIHGAYNEIHTTLKNIKLIDDNDNWSGGTSHFVSLGDMLDRGPSSKKVMDLYMKLQVQAKEAGGVFHIVLGNHEVMVLTQDLRYLSREEYEEFSDQETTEERELAYKKYLKNSSASVNDNALLAFNTKYPKGYFAHKRAFSSKGKYGQWLLDLPFIIKINDQLFVHGGLSSDLLGTSLEDTNRDLKKSLKRYIKSWESFTKREDLGFELEYSSRSFYVNNMPNTRFKNAFLDVQDDFLFSTSSPIWHRGNSMCHPFFESDSLSYLLAQWGATKLWVGHTTTPNRVPNHRLNNQLVIMDTGMLRSYYRGEPWAAKITPNNVPEYINGLSGMTSESIQSPNRHYSLPYGMSEEEIEDFLKTADIIDEESTEFGVTKPRKITLEKDGRSISGIFKFVDTTPNAQRRKWELKNETSDRFQYEMAAYKLDRMIGIGLVPPTVERSVNGRAGVIQLWINGLTSKLSMNRNSVTYSGYCNRREQLNMLYTFDYLILNKDRNQSNILYTEVDGQVWFIDHSRAFGTSTKQLSKNKKRRIIMPTEAFKAALKKISRDDLSELRRWLHRKQIASLWKRLNFIVDGTLAED